MPKTNAENVKAHYDRNKEEVLKKKRDRYHANKIKKVEAKLPLVEAKLPLVEAKLPLVEAKLPLVEAKLPLVEAKLPLVEAPLESKTELIEIQPEQELKNKSELVDIPIDTFTQIYQMISGLEIGDSLKKFRKINFKNIINILKPNDYNDLIFKLTKQPNKIIKLIKNFEYQTGCTYSVNTQIIFFKAILFFLEKFEIFIKPDKKSKYEDAIQIGDVVSSQELQVKNNTNNIPTFEEYLQKCVEHFGDKSREYLIAKIYHEVACRDDLQLILLSDPIRLNREKNYIIVNEFPNATIIINDYKTVDKYGRFNTELSEELTLLIKSYIITNCIQTGELFFNSNNISMIVSRMNKKLGFEGFGAINLFRKMLSSDAKDLPLKEQLKLAKKLKHSLKVHNENYIVNESI